MVIFFHSGDHSFIYKIESLLGNNPFMKNDVTSVSAMMGVDKTSKQYWLRKNPNAVGKNTGNRKKKKDR